MSVHDAIRRLLREASVPFEEVEHPPVRTAEEAARARGTALEVGVKAIVFKADGRFALFALSAARGIRSRLLRRHLGVRRTRFASAAELRELTGLPPGAVPPFGRPVLPLPLYADPSVLAADVIAFTPGVNTVSMLVASRDWRRVARPEVFPFAAESEG